MKAVDGVSFDLREGEVLGLVGESGSGKTTLGRALLGLVRPTGGSVKLRGEELVGLPERELRPKRRHLQMVFQDPHASLNPGMTLERALAHPLQIHKLTKGDAETQAKVREVLELVNLAPVEQFATRLPSDLSGGQKQRAAIARAIILGPDLVVADEPVSMLDMSVRAKILDLLIDLKQRLGLTYVYVTHDLASAKFFCDRVAIMYLGRIVEIGTVDADLRGPQAPVHAGADPRDPGARPRQGAAARPAARRGARTRRAPPLGCSFHPRCPKAFEICGWESRDLRAILEERWVAAGEETYAAERPLVGDLETLGTGDHEAFVPAGSAGSGRAAGDARADPRRGARRAAVEGRAGDDARRRTACTCASSRGHRPVLYETGGAQAACLLYREP